MRGLNMSKITVEYTYIYNLANEWIRMMHTNCFRNLDTTLIDLSYYDLGLG